MTTASHRQAHGSVPTDRSAGVRWTMVAAFIALSCGLAWLAALPLWLQDGLRTPGFFVIGSVVMFTPAVAAVVMRLVERRRYGNDVPMGLTVRPLKRTLGLSALAVVVTLAVCVAAVALSAIAGTYRLDAGALEPATLVSSVAMTVVMSVVLAVLIFGEELGWRGWLLPHLKPLGTWPALLLSGFVWGVWHAPLILLGYNYNRAGLTGMALMVGFTMLVGILIGWARLRSGSLWPAVFAHAAINASGGGMALLPPAPGSTVDPSSASLLGWPGWIVMAALISAGVVVSVMRSARKQ